MHIDKKITDRYNIFKKLCCGNFRRGDTNGLDLTPGNNTGTRNIADAVTLEAENAGVYFGSNNRMFWYSTAVNPVTAQRNANKTAILNMEALNAQFMDNEGKLVDYLRDYDAGDAVRFSDTIRRIEYNVSEDITTFYFFLGDEWLGWPFSGDYRSQYSVGSPLNLSFQVVSIGRYGTYQFESLDYFEQVFAGEKTGTIPSLEGYV